MHRVWKEYKEAESLNTQSIHYSQQTCKVYNKRTVVINKIQIKATCHTSLFLACVAGGFWVLDEYEGGGAAKTSGGAGSRKTQFFSFSFLSRLRRSFSRLRRSKLPQNRQLRRLLYSLCLNAKFYVIRAEKSVAIVQDSCVYPNL